MAYFFWMDFLISPISRQSLTVEPNCIYWLLTALATVIALTCNQIEGDKSYSVGNTQKEARRVLVHMLKEALSNNRRQYKQRVDLRVLC